MPTKFQFEQWVPFPLEQVFAFFYNPENLSRIMPAAMEAKIVRLELKAPRQGKAVPKSADQAAGTGSIIVTSFRVISFLPIRAQWTSSVTEFEWNQYFADVQDKGPFTNWHHRHEFRREQRDSVDGTVVGDVVD